MIRRRRRLAVVAGALAGAGALALLAPWGPALVVTAVLTAPALEAWIAPLLGDVTRDDVPIATGSGTLRADRYRPAGGGSPRAALLLVHGLSAAGRAQPDLARLARLLGRTGLLVVVPHFDGLVAFRLTGREVDDVRAALAYTAGLAPSTGIAGFSFGAGPALLAAADRDLTVVGSFGGYADLGHVIVFIATGRHEFAGARHAQVAEPYNRWKLAALLVPFVDDAGDRARVAGVVDAKLRNPGGDTSAAEAALGVGAQALLALVRAGDEGDARRRLAELPSRVRDALAALSPVPAMPRLRGRLLIAHGADDPSIPFTESLRLAEAAGGGTRAVILGGFHHTGPADVWRSARDAWRLLALVDALVRSPTGRPRRSSRPSRSRSGAARRSRASTSPRSRGPTRS